MSPPITVILEAKYLPDSTVVRKATGGAKQYVLRTKLPLYTEPGLKLAVVEVQDGVRFLISEGAVNIIAPERLLAIDFPDVKQAALFFIALEQRTTDDPNG